MTNHHCAHACIEQLSTPQRDYVASGFYAASEAEEVKCPELEVNQLAEISDNAIAPYTRCDLRVIKCTPHT